MDDHVPLDSPVATRAVEMLVFATELQPPARWIMSDPSQISHVLKLPLKCHAQEGVELESYLSLLDASLAWLGDDEVQKFAVQHPHIDEALQLLQGVLENVDRRRDDFEDETEQDIRNRAELMLKSLCDISSRDEFSEYALNDAVIQKLVGWVRGQRSPVLSEPSPIGARTNTYEINETLATCACLMLGNVARSNQTCVSMVEDFAVHLAAISVIRCSNDPRLLHAAAGFLRHLAFATSIKDRLGDEGLLEECFRLFELRNENLDLAGLSTLRQLVRGSHRNCERLLSAARSIEASTTPHDDNERPHLGVSDTDSSTTTILPPQRTYLAALLDICYRHIGSDSPAAKSIISETARLIVSILRTIKQADSEPQAYSPSKSTSHTTLVHRLYAETMIANPLLLVIQNRIGAAAVSEAWFGLALTAQHREGAVVVLNSFTERGSFSLLKGVVHQIDGDQEVPSADRDNAIALVRLLLAHAVSWMLIHGRAPHENSV